MTNKEFIQTLLVSGKISKRDLVNDEDLKRVCITDRFLGNIYLKLEKLPDIRHYHIMTILSRLVITYDLNDREIDVLIGNLRIVKECTDVDYIKHISHIREQLGGIRNRRNIIEELYKCEVYIENFGKGIFVCKIYLGNKVYLYTKHFRSTRLIDATNNDIVADGIKFIGFDDNGIKFIRKTEYSIKIQEYFRYRYKLYIVNSSK